MRKLVEGIVKFRREMRPGYREQFAHLALGQTPDTFFVACSDSRVVPNLFASTDPGDMFVVRNVGNIVPPAGWTAPGTAAAVEFAARRLGVKDAVVCGHSDCGAMRALTEDGGAPGGHLGPWLEAGRVSLELLKDRPDLAPRLPPHDRLSQANVLRQVDNLRTHASIQEQLARGLRLHAWWFDLQRADVHAYEPDLGRFVLLDETEAERILARLKD